MNEENLKTCRYCAEQIKATAKICPRCRQWLSVFSLRNVSILIVMTWIWTFYLMIGLVVTVHRWVNPGTNFAPYRSQIAIVESRMCCWTNKENALFVSVIAVVTNQTDMAWRETEIDARFFDKAGTLIDIGRGEYYDTLYPKTDGAIRINAGMLRPLADYDSYKIYIGSAKDSNSRF
jgi:hypothetical protein